MITVETKETKGYFSHKLVVRDYEEIIFTCNYKNLGVLAKVIRDLKMLNFSSNKASLVTKMLNFLGVKPVNVFSRCRKREYVQPRQLMQTILKFCVDKGKIRNMSLARIGEECGGVDHATVLHSIKTVKRDYEMYGCYKRDTDELIRYLGLDLKDFKKWIVS